MLFTTLQYNGVEKCLADWGISAATREVSNQAHDHFGVRHDVGGGFLRSTSPTAAKIILRIGRLPSIDSHFLPSRPSSVRRTPASGGGTKLGSWAGAWIISAPAARTLEKLDYKFAETRGCFSSSVWCSKSSGESWNGSANVADWRSQIILGQSVNALIGVNDTIPGTNATNLMSIRQQVAEIAAYVINQTTADYGSPQFQTDSLTYAFDGTNYDLYETPGTNIIIPDYIAGAYAVSGKTSASAGGSAGNMQTVLRAPLDSVNDITCADAMRRMLRWIGPTGSPVVWFDYTTTPPTLHISTRDQLPSVSLPLIGQSAGFKIKRRDDLIPGCIALKFRVVGTVSGAQYTEVINDIAGTIGGTVYEGVGQTGLLQTIQSFAGGSPAYIGGAANSATMQALQTAARDFAAVTATIDMEGNSSNVTYCSIAAIAVDLSSNAAAGRA